MVELLLEERCEQYVPNSTHLQVSCQQRAVSRELQGIGRPLQLPACLPLAAHHPPASFPCHL